MKKSTYYLLIVIFLIGIMQGCQMEKEHKPETNNDHLLLATLFQQKAAEKRALSYQAYNLAKFMLDSKMRSARLTKKLAVVVDIDETVLDNSPFEAKSILENTDYPEYWDEWCNLADAKPIAGAVDFLNYAKSKGVEVFYITNRKIKFFNVTLKNLSDKGFPYADKEHLLMRTDKSDKEPRRNIVKENYEIALLIGDNLGDFLNIFDDANIEDRFSLTDSLRNEFGRNFIVLPNSMYGAWVNELFDNNFDLEKEEKINKFKEQLIDF